MNNNKRVQFILMSSSAVVLVLGDIGRSPRMCNHALSLVTQANMSVDIVGYNGRYSVCS